MEFFNIGFRCLYQEKSPKKQDFAVAQGVDRRGVIFKVI